MKLPPPPCAVLAGICMLQDSQCRTPFSLNFGFPFCPGVLPLCEPAGCWSGLPVSLQSYTDNCSGLAFKESCTLQCAAGYTAHGDHRTHRPGSNGSDGGLSVSSTYRCGSNGVAQTDSTRPTCTLQTCISNFSLPGVLTTCEDVPFAAILLRRRHVKKACEYDRLSRHNQVIATEIGHK